MPAVKAEEVDGIMNTAVKYMYLHFNTQEIIFNSKTIIGVHNWQCMMRYITFKKRCIFLYIYLHVTIEHP